MATINFYLRPEMKDNKDLVPVYLIYQDKGRKFKHYTGQKVHSHDWDHEKQEVKSESDKASEINYQLRKQHDKLKTAIQNLKDSGSGDSLENVKNHFKSYYTSPASKNNFFELFEEFIFKAKELKKDSTILIYQSVLKDIHKFNEEHEYQLDFNKINGEFYEHFTNYLTEKLNNTNNTVSKKIKTLKVFLKYASEKKLVDYSSYYKFKTRTDSPVRVILSDNELSKIFNLNLSLRKELQDARDIFLFSCFTGLKFSEIMKLKHEDVKGGKVKMTNHFTGKEISIPLNNYASMIIKRHENLKLTYSFPQIQNVYMNKFVKELAKLAKIEKPVEITIHKGKEIIKQTKPKYELITTDTARFTFASLSLQAGMRPELLILILGQKNINSLLQYAIDSNPMKDIEMVNVWNKKVF
jgi:site-specific recombinase XerD